MMTFRQAQVAALTSVGASNKEIANILGIGEATIKTYKKQLRVIQKTYNVDYWGLPLDRDGRNKEFKRICRNVMLKYKFGEKTNEQTASNTKTTGKNFDAPKHDAHRNMPDVPMQQ